MKFVMNGEFKENIHTLLRKAGYILQGIEEKNREFNFIRPLERSGYPRFHLFLKTGDGNLILNLHLDQKRPIYRGSAAHSGEYEGRVVEEESERIRKILESEKT